jgi:hypothetical protein
LNSPHREKTCVYFQIGTEISLDNTELGWAWWGASIIPVLERLRQENLKLESSLGDIASSRSACAILGDPVSDGREGGREE